MVSVILDTNSVIAYINGDHEAAKKIEQVPELLLPTTVIGKWHTERVSLYTVKKT